MLLCESVASKINKLLRIRCHRRFVCLAKVDGIKRKTAANCFSRMLSQKRIDKLHQIIFFKCIF